MDLAHEPQTLTVEEAARILRIGRTAAYALAREWRATNGRSGLPVLELGRTLRVPRHALELMLTCSWASGEAPAPYEPSAPAPSSAGSSQSQLWDEAPGTES
jgi:hypothetical protein